ncbi:hypothetical protein MHK_004176 [Candidatus Magnetomorum sp. HK-1]|nr:hypothetical protein MHK_004176 [Candidatus Magnetomorum sp. HK-1]
MSNKPISTRICNETFNRLSKTCKKEGKSRAEMVANILDKHFGIENPESKKLSSDISLYMEQQETLIQNIAKIQSMVENIRRTNGFLLTGIKLLGNGNKALEKLFTTFKSRPQ